MSRLKLSLHPDDLHRSGPLRLRPGGREPLGLGDVVASVAGFVGLHPCAGCRKRRHVLNRIKVGAAVIGLTVWAGLLSGASLGIYYLVRYL